MKILLPLFLLMASTLQAQVWSQLDDFPGSARDDGTAFVINGEAYCGTGRNVGFAVTADFYVFNAMSEQWSAINSLPDSAARQYALGLAHGGYGYIFGGINAQGEFLNDLWRYNPASDAWLNLGTGPFEGRSGVQGFVLEDTLYFVGGKTSGSNAINELWCYSIPDQNWFQGANIPADGVWRGFGVSNDTLGIVGMGVDSINQKRGEVYFFHKNTQSWTEVPALKTDSISYPAAVLRNNRVLIYGGELNDGGYSNAFRYINLSDSTWNNLNSLPATARRGGMAFSTGNDFYLTTGITTQTRLSETWRVQDVVGLTYIDPFFDWLNDFTYVLDDELLCSSKWENCFLTNVLGQKWELELREPGKFIFPDLDRGQVYYYFLSNDIDCDGGRLTIF